jgi:protein-disulfide isomerase
VERVWAMVASNDAGVSPPVAPRPVARIADTTTPMPSPTIVAAVAKPKMATANFKEYGSGSAPVCLEIYIDFDCVHCANFVRDVAPGLMADYVEAGKVRLRYRDFPLPTHRFAKLAARYADAAGQLGYYDAVMTHIFETRTAWDENGDVDTEVAQVLPSDVMEKVRDRLKSDPKVDDIIAADQSAGLADHLDRTPFGVIVYEGQRRAITDAPLTLESLKKRIDEVLEKK